MEEILNKKLVHISGKILAVVVTIFLSIGAMLYNDNKNRINVLETRVSSLVYDKVSRTELREDLQQLRLQNEANKIDIIARQESMKKDILDRLKFISDNK